jgi:hypothetical protein
MFYPFSRDEIRPYFVQDVVEGMEIDVLETNLIGQEAQSATLPDERGCDTRKSDLQIVRRARSHRRLGPERLSKVPTVVDMPCARKSNHPLEQTAHLASVLALLQCLPVWAAARGCSASLHAVRS